MRRIMVSFWAALAVMGVLWLAADTPAWPPETFIALRAPAVQLTGILAMTCMSMAMILALRPRWPEGWMGGLDKMYRLHKWFGIGGLVLAVLHWAWTQSPGWAVSLGLLEPGRRPQRGLGGSAVQQWLGSLRGTAEQVGEWAFYAAVLLIAVALIRRIPYRLFQKTHRLIALAYLALIFHAVVLLKFPSWPTLLGAAMAAMMAAGAFAALVALLRRIGAGRRVRGRIARLEYHPALHVMEAEIDLPQGWPGHKAGQFAFVTSDWAEGAHPYTIASAWDARQPRIMVIAKELGDWTRRLRDTLRLGQAVQVEGPYGCFTFDDGRPRQIWIGGGIGITPFIARMKHLAAHPSRQDIDLIHSTTDHEDEAIARLAADAQAAGVRLHVLVDARDGLLTGERLRAMAPGWRDASVWFCGPAGFGRALREDLRRHGLPAGRFHQEVFNLR
ncbi:Flavohemoprotein [Paracoccus haematequi]|uniref:Flavohemoprotein n=1 Tax=Paracoccus haematequi TaxID=2491866 RepID=A0A447IMB0_9RHOB|nr:ferric reductase-like transmembrane domain-containing protein [Paracoccus haematequi]VDS08610.1 Flavohemoprotein [Paracoccus haematequi]